MFQDIVESIYFSEKNERNTFFEVGINEFRDPDELKLDIIFTLPLTYINNLELQYRIYNKLPANEAFQEAYTMWKIFCEENYKLWKRLRIKYPDIYTTTFKEHIKQYNALMNIEFKNREHVLIHLYS